MHIGLIGLGKMGFNMRERLRKGGVEVTGYDRNPDVTDADRPVLRVDRAGAGGDDQPGASGDRGVGEGRGSQAAGPDELRSGVGHRPIMQDAGHAHRRTGRAEGA